MADSRRQVFRSAFRFPWTSVVSLSWIVMIKAFDPSLFYSIQLASEHESTVHYSIKCLLNVAFYLSLPVVGLMGDIKLGRINAIIVCVFIGAVCSIACIVQSVLFKVYSSNTMVARDAIMLVALPLTGYSREVLRMVAFIIGTNQLIEMSSTSQQLSSYVWWYYWCNSLGAVITEVTGCLVETHRDYNMYSTAAHLMLLALILVSALVMKRRVNNYSSGNPLRLIGKILCFALKNKYPIERSALTYWEEDKLSRVNFGKTKYGGPFQEKDVESVKTFFRLLPVVATVTGVQFPYQVIGRVVSGRMAVEHCLLHGTYFIQYCTAIIIVPLYQLFLRYCNCSVINVSMLKKIGLGIALTAISKLGYVLVELYISIPIFQANNEAMCILANNTAYIDDLYIDDTYLYFLPEIVNSLGTLLIIPGSLEFVFAQAPHCMQGLLIGLWYGIGGLYETAGYLMIDPFKSLSQYLVPSCELYVFIMNFLFMVACLMIFVKVSRWYKLHNHEDVFSAHHIAENFYEKEFNRREYYYSQYGSIH